MASIKFKISLLMMVIFLSAEGHAQIFISKAKIEYEVKSDIKKTMGKPAERQGRKATSLRQVMLRQSGCK